MDLVVDTSALINLFFGSTRNSEKVQKIISAYDKICITNIIRYEFRNYFLDFIPFIEIYKSIINEFQEDKINVHKIFPDLLEELSRRYFRKSQRFGRMRIIFEEVLENYHKWLLKTILKGLRDNENLKPILIDRLKTLILDYQIKLKNVYDQLDPYMVIKDFDCVLSNWTYFYDANKDEFVIDEKRACYRICFEIDEKLSHFAKKNQLYINNILKNYLKLSKERNIVTYDKNLIPILQKIKKNEITNIGVRDCKRLGDLFISSIINDKRHVLTNNKNHFLLLLLCKNVENSLILF
ncbi:MAG: hypothetical protein ACXACX_15355 [Candidatus Hodarchaeales archaeon]